MQLGCNALAFAKEIVDIGTAANGWRVAKTSKSQRRHLLKFD